METLLSVITKKQQQQTELKLRLGVEFGLGP